MENIKNIIEIIQGLVIIGATIFTARWTYKTFAHKEKIDELKELKKTIELYYQKITMFCSQVRDNQILDDKELSEKLELVSLHNKLYFLQNISLYNKPDFRKKIKTIVGGWLTNKRFEKMQYRASSEIPENERKELWKKFDQEHKEVTDLIDAEAKKYIS